MGHESEAREVAIEENRQHRKHGGLGRLSGCWDWVLYFTTRYGYQPRRAFLLLFVLWLLGSGMFWMAQQSSLMAPTRVNAFRLFQSKTPSLPPGYPSFQPPLYALDFFLPGINLYQKSNWQLHERRPADWPYRGYAVFSVFYFLLGWIFTAVALGAITGVLKPP